MADKKFKIYKEDLGRKCEDILGGAVGINNSHILNAVPLGLEFEDLEVGQGSSALCSSGQGTVYVIVERVL